MKLMRRSSLILVLVTSVSLVCDAVATAQISARPQAKTNKLYIVQMSEFPVASYTGGTPGLRSTKPGHGQKIDPNSPDVVAYSAYLNNRHSQVLGAVGAVRKVYDYDYTFNGFTAELAPGQAAALTKVSGVLNVTKDELQTTNTSSTPTFLGLDAPGGLWDQLGGVGTAGEDIIIGMIDSGVWPESLSFSDRTGQNGNASKDGKLSYRQVPGWHGKCVPGEQFSASMCNQKLIGAQRFDAAWGGDAGLKEDRPWEFASPRDYNGHGTHTASTAGGNFAVPTTGLASALGPIKGIAPRARIVAYKALYSTQDAFDTNGFTSDLLAAIDRAVADGVDVINYSVSGTSTNFLDPIEMAFLFAADANVFVAAAAGNDGPTPATVIHPGPWLTTVAAGTHNRDGEGSVTLGNNATYSGASVAPAVGPAPFIDSTAAGLPGADPTAVALCFSAFDTTDGEPALDPAKVAGKIVLCDRGVNARAFKSFAVQQAGGAGMILVNTSPNSLNADFHYVPTVHVADTQRAALKAYAALPNATARINRATILYDLPAPFTADFSSRGPLLAGSGDLLKPDLIAPGENILAAVAPPGNFGESFFVYDGTSMASPHVAGLAALLKDLHPDWTPMMIKSALMTSASDVLDGPNTDPLVIFGQGAGHVRPNSAADPGLVYNAGFNDWLAFLCGTTTGVNPSVCSRLSAAGYSLDPSDLNVASIAIGDLLGVQTVTRKVTNVGHAAVTYNASVSGMAGFTVAVTPSSLSISPGETKSYTVTITRTTATLDEYAGGQLTWTDGSHNVRIPMVVRPL
jgi:subtilisin family serine protease